MDHFGRDPVVDSAAASSYEHASLVDTDHLAVVLALGAV
jgi:hypothetical protein